MQQIAKTEYFKTGVTYMTVPQDVSLTEILDEAYKELEKTHSPLQMVSIKKLTFVTVDGVRIPRRAFKTTFPKKGAHIHIHRRVAGGGSGGGVKNIITGVLMVVAAVAISFFSFGTLLAPSLSSLAALGAPTMMMLQAGASTLLLAAGASMLLQGVFAQPAPSLGGMSNLGLDAGGVSSAYSITGVENTLRPNETVPVVLGAHRVTPPLGARNWTSWESNEQFFHMCVIWGQSDLDVEDMRIGETPVSYYTDIEINTIVTTGSDFKFYAQSPFETSIGAELTQAAGWVTRTVGEAEDISVDIQFNTLFSVHAENGSVQSASVAFELQYKQKSSDVWLKDFFANTFDIPAFETLKFYAPKVRVKDSDGDYRWAEPTIYIYIDTRGIMQASLNAPTGEFIAIAPEKTNLVVGCNVTIERLREGYIDHDGDQAYRDSDFVNIFVTAGTYTHDGGFVVTNDNRDFVMKTYRKNGLPKAIYDIRIRRVSADTDSQYIYDKASWATTRAWLNRPAFNSIQPVKATELRIKASAQLSSYISNLNAMVYSKADDWGGENWVYRRTRNPASLARYLLTSKECLYEPYEVDALDDVDFVEAHEWSTQKNYTFDFILDTQVLLWDRLTQILSPARCTPTVDNNGLWGIIIDRADKEVKQLFTGRNSWGLSVQRAFPEPPHALRVSFIDSTDDYARKEGYVCAEGYTMDTIAEPHKQPAIDVQAYDYPGCVTWEDNVRAAWCHLAKITHRSLQVTLNTDWEYIAIRRGDVVEVGHSVLLNQYGDGKITALVYEDEDTGDEIWWDDAKDPAPTNADGDPLQLIGVKLDDTIIYDNPNVRYAIKIRYNSGKVGTFELDSPYNDFYEHEVLYFKYPPPASATPVFSNLCTVGDLSKESYNKYIYAGANFGENFTAEMSLIPYAQPIIEEATENQTIPPYVPPIILDQVHTRKLPTPSVLDIKSDEGVLLVSASGGTIPQIKVWAKIPPSSFDAGKVFLQMSAQKDGGGVIEYASGEQGIATVRMANVTEGTIYSIRIRAVDYVTGVTSDWTAPILHTVIGRTTRPPAPSAVYMSGNIVEIQQTNRPLDVVGHVVTVCMDATDTIDMGVVVTNPYTTNGVFDISAWSGRARRIFVETIDELGLKSAPVGIIINLGDIVPENVILVISEREKDWSGSIHGGYVNLDDDLSAGDSVKYFAESGNKYFPESGDKYFPTGTGQTLQYTYSVYLEEGLVGASLFVDPLLETGRVQKVEYRLFMPQKYFPASGQKYFSESGQKYFVQDTLTEWQPMPDKFVISKSATIEVRITTINTELTVFDDIFTKIDVPDKEIIVSDLDVSADGTSRIPVPPNTLRALTNAQLTLQYLEGNVGVSAEFVRGSEEIEDGFLTSGYLLRVVDSNGHLVQGNVDIIAKGY